MCMKCQKNIEKRIELHLKIFIRVVLCLYIVKHDKIQMEYFSYKIIFQRTIYRLN